MNDKETYHSNFSRCYHAVTTVKCCRDDQGNTANHVHKAWKQKLSRKKSWMVILRRSIGLSQNLLVDFKISSIVVILAYVVVRLLMTEFFSVGHSFRWEMLWGGIWITANKMKLTEIFRLFTNGPKLSLNFYVLIKLKAGLASRNIVHSKTYKDCVTFWSQNSNRKTVILVNGKVVAMKDLESVQKRET